MPGKEPHNPNKKRRDRSPPDPGRDRRRYADASEGWDGIHRCTSGHQCPPHGCGRPVNLRVLADKKVHPLHFWGEPPAP